MSFFILSAVSAGLLFAVQGSVNTALGRQTGKLQATAFSFGTGMLILLFSVCCIGSGDLSQIHRVPVWQLIGGIYGAWGVFVSVTVIPSLGLALTLTTIMLGQLLMASFIDAFGLLLTTPVPVSGLRIFGILVIAAGILLIYDGSKTTQAPSAKASLNMLLLALSAGLASAVQSPTNAALASVVGTLESTFVSFTGGFTAIFFVLLIRQRGKLFPVSVDGIRPWMLPGGILGATAIFLNILSMPHLGVALQLSSGMLGQLAGSFAIDSFGLLGTNKVPLNRKRFIGILLIAAGVIVVSLAKSTAH